MQFIRRRNCPVRKNGIGLFRFSRNARNETIPLLRDEKLEENDLINLANFGINDTLTETLNDTLNDILKLLKNNPKLKQKEIVEQLKISEITVI